MEFFKKTDKNEDLETKAIKENKNQDIKTKVLNENLKDAENKETVKDSKKHKIIMVSLICTVVLVIILVCTTGFALLNINNTKIIPNIKVNNIKVEGLTKDEAFNLITEKINDNLEKEIKFKADEFEYTVKLSQIEAKYNVEQAVENAYNTGRNSNIFVNNFNILKSMIIGFNINIEDSYNEDLLNEIVDDISVKIPNAVEESSYYIEEDKLIVTKGKPGKSIKKEEVKNTILSKIQNNNDKTEELPIIDSEPNAIDIDKIYSEVHTEAKDAYYTKDPFQIYAHVNGVDFDIESARELLKEDKEEYEIKLTITKPEITTDKIGTEAFPDLLSSFSTKYDASNTNRSTNLKLAAGKINGTVLMPGENFSYNKVVGERTIAKGYKEAGGFSGGKVVQMLGGGICQIASTLYDTVLYANLEIVERRNHVFSAGYVGAGKDATVVYGSIDFKFKNSRKYPIMIKTYVSNGIAKMEIYGIKEEVEYEVEIASTILNYIPYNVVYETDNSLAPGQEKVAQNGMQGMKSITYKILRLNGAEVSRKVLSTDTYDAMNKIIKKGPAAIKTPVPTQTVEPPVVEEEKQVIEEPANTESIQENTTNTEVTPAEPIVTP